MEVDLGQYVGPDGTAFPGRFGVLIAHGDRKIEQALRRQVSVDGEAEVEHVGLHEQPLVDEPNVSEAV